MVHGAAQPNNQCTNFLNGLFRHYAFPIKSLKRIQIEPIKNPKRIQVEPNHNILSNLYILSMLSQSEYSRSLVGEKHFRIIVTRESRLVCNMAKSLSTTFWETLSAS